MSKTVGSLYEEIYYVRSLVSVIYTPVMSTELLKTVERAGREVEGPF